MLNKFLLLLLFTFLLPLLSLAEWTSFRANAEGQASLRLETPPVLNEWYYNYKTLQRYEPGLAPWASPALAVVEGKPIAFIGGYAQTLLAMDIANKKVKWLKVTNGVIQSAPIVATVDGKQIVFFGSADRTIYALNASTGQNHWTKELIPPSATQGQIFMTSPLFHNNRIYINCFVYDRSIKANQQQAFMVCLDATTGTEYWRHHLTEGYVSSPVGFLLKDQFHIVIAARKGFVQCFKINDLQPKQTWTYQMAHEVFGSPVVEQHVDNPYLFLGSKFGNLVALDATTGEKKWQQMAGNWIDNTACIGNINGKKIVFTGSHDYKLYAFDAKTGRTRWSRPLGGEVYSAPTFFDLDGEPAVAVSCLDNHIYVVNAETGAFHSAYFTGEPLWDKAPKGETLLGSPVAVEAGKQTVLVHGSYNSTICVFPLLKECSFRDHNRSFDQLWWSLPILLGIFLFIVLPILLKWPEKPIDK